MRKNRRWALLLIAVMLVGTMGLAGCSTDTGGDPATGDSGKSSDKVNTSGEKYTIGWSERALAGTPWFEAMVSAAKEEAAKNGAELIVIDAQNKPDKQVADVEDLIARQVDAIILDPCDPKAILTALQAANEAGIPVVGVNSAIDNSNPKAQLKTLITSDNYTIGYNVGYAIGKEWNKANVNVAIMSGHPGDIEGWQRRSGFLAGFAEYQYEKFGASNINVIAQRYAGDWDPEKGMSQMQDILVTHKGEIDVLFSEGDAMALGCLTAIKTAGEKILIGSIDGQLEAIEALKAGDFTAIGVNSAVDTGKTGVQQAIKSLQGETIQSRIYVPSPTITKENVDKLYKPGVPFL